MSRKLRSRGPFAASATVGGLFIGAIEAAYRGAPLLYAALLYAALWALLACLLALLVALTLRRSLRATTGLTLALGGSGLALGRYIAFRDLFHEAPERSLAAYGVALAAALLLAGVSLAIGGWLRRRMRTEAVGGTWLWLVPAAAMVAMLAMTVGDDEPTSPPTSLPASAPHPLRGRGVILVVVDALRADALGVYGAPPHREGPPSPKIDEFAKSALLYTDVSSQSSWTRPAVATLLTSRHASAHGTMSKNAVLPATLPTVASVLQERGIATAAVVTNYNLEPEYGFARGFGNYRYLAPARYLDAPPEATRLAAYQVFRLLRERFFTSHREARYFYRSGAEVNANALALLDAVGDGDFFLYLHYMEPHDPYFAVDGTSFARVSTPKPPLSWASRMRAAYGDEVQRADTYFGQLLQALRERGLMARTTLILTADHGEEFAEHGGFYHGTTLYEEQLHVPLMIATPGLAAGKINTLARSIDVAPTVLARFGVAAPAAWEGRDLLGATPVPTLTFAEEDHEGNALKALRQGSNKLIVANSDNPRGLAPFELYDLQSDQHETHALARPGLQAQLQARLQAEIAQAAVGGASAGTRPLDSDAEAALRSLGYMQ
jgi:arylsulfatase A-like enzyme